MPKQPDCIVKVGGNLKVVANYYRGEGWKCPAFPEIAAAMNDRMATIEIDLMRYYPDPVRPVIEELVKQLNAKYVKPLVYNVKTKVGVVY